ncbi:hypothetical protein [Parasphingorhabdus cellanae]|uniref:YcxB-like protein domain-containing protein n=1 Tax=Parasphingorhabdus cellanae TaxID=2806553 RepID=A0ABX7T4I8_9SPHN|nr:hypothetical protein [Parasphingorhabdus cellanae]QTD56051.1 hypothetical protein J4G78_00085 [Parasphingorhabdus cellanae]
MIRDQHGAEVSVSRNDDYQSFHYHQSVAPMLWVLLALSFIELFVVHFLVSFFYPTAAIVISIITAISIGWLIRFLLSMKKMPVRLGPEELVMCLGNSISITVDRGNIAGTRDSWSEESLKNDNVLRLSLLAYPNLVLDLKEPVTYTHFWKKRSTMAIAHRLDDLDAFHRALKLEINNKVGWKTN